MFVDEDLAKKKNEDLENIWKKIVELVGYAWERGYKCCEAEHEQQAKENSEFYIGDVVRNKFLGNTGIIVGLSYDGKQSFASVYTRNSVAPQKVPLEDLITTRQHVNVSLDFFNKALTDIQEVKNNGNT